MKTVQQTTKDALRNNTTLYTSTRATIEWNYNRIYSGQAANGGYSGTEWYPEYYPITSLLEMNRPSRSGIVTLDFGQAISYPASNTLNSIGTRGRKTYTTNQAVYNTANVDAKYKYWVSPTPSSTVASSGKYSIGDCTPTVTYGRLFVINKVRVIFEDSQVKPVDYTIDVQQTVNGSWTTIASNIAPVNGVVEVYQQTNNSWSTALNYAGGISVAGIRVNVTTVNQPSSRAAVIELSPIFGADVTGYLENYSFDSATSEQSFVSPLGTPSANTGTIVLNNYDQVFNNVNAASPYFNMLTRYHPVFLDEGVATDSGTEWIRSGTMLTDVWSGQDQEQTSVSLIDKAVYLQNIKPLAMLIQNRTAGECIWRMLESVGFTDYNYAPVASETVIPYFWVDGESTVWDVITKLSEQMQMAVYFDDYGILQIDTRETIFNESAAKSWTFYGQPSGSAVTDIEGIDKTYQYASNIVNINWTPTSVSDVKFGTASMETSWEADGDVVLRSSPMSASVGSNAGDSVFINGADAATWPYKGVFVVEDEYVSYNGKGYVYYDNNNNPVSKVLLTQDDYDKIQRDFQSYSWRNYFTGQLVTDKRGYYGTPVIPHTIGKPSYWQTFFSRNDGTGTRSMWETGSWVNYTNGTLRMENTSLLSAHTAVMSRISSSGVPGLYGTSVMMPSSGKGTGRHGGLAFCLQTDAAQSGYYLQIIQSDKITADQRKYYQEITFYSRSGGQNRIIWTAAKQVNPDTYYDLMVQFSPTTYSYVIWIDDQPVQIGQVPSAYRLPNTNRFGVFNKYYGTVDYDYIWSSTISGSIIGADMPDYASIIDRINGGFITNALFSMERARQWYDAQRQYTPDADGGGNSSNRFGVTFDDFAPIVHEVREFDVKYTKAPAIYSRLYSSNEAHSWVPSFKYDPFRAKFTIIHYGRDKFAVLNGSDTYSFGADNPVDQKLLVYGRTVNTEDSLKYTVKNDDSIARIGEISVDFEATWIQSEDGAKALGDWIIKHWGNGQDELSIDSFYNPLLEIGDVVGVEYSALSLSSSDKYVVTKISKGYDSGPTTKFTLRKLPSGV